jgi:hypothetical protein
VCFFANEISKKKRKDIYIAKERVKKMRKTERSEKRKGKKKETIILNFYFL